MRKFVFNLLSTLILVTSLIAAAYVPTIATTNDELDTNIKKSSQQVAVTIENTGVKEAITSGLDAKVAKLALHAYKKALTEGHVKSHVLTIIDYSLPSDRKRLWVVDIDQGKVIHHSLVAHGKNTGNRYAKNFSNSDGTHESSIGVYETSNTYYGSQGYSLRLKGLDKGYNDNALERAIVVHGAWYVNENMAKSSHRVGRSWGCPAIPTKVAKSLINDIKNGSVVFAYYPDNSWLHHSKYLA